MVVGVKPFSALTKDKGWAVPVTIKFCGGTRTVTGSMHYLSAPHTNLILDCGLFHGHRDEYYEVNSHFAFNPQNLDACVLSHAHIDHSGNIPSLVKSGFRAPIYCTPATRDFCRYMLPDSGFIQEEDLKYVNKVNKRRGLPPRVPLYTKKEAERALRHFRTLPLHRSLAIGREVNLSFYEAGHILGAAVSVLDIGLGGRSVRVAYAVDLGRENMPLLRNPEAPEDIDYLIMESTYGGKKHEDLAFAQQRLARAITDTVKRGGKVIIPSFALERTQLVVFFISELMKKKVIKKLPIYVDGPLAVNLTKVFRQHQECFNEMTQRAFLSQEDPLGYDNISYITDVNNSKKLNSLEKPAIIISASGMCENGRILHHLKNNIENPSNTVIIVGYMAMNTLGRSLVERKETVRIFGRPYDLKAEVVVINAFSSHADKDGLWEYCLRCRGRLKKVFLVHGEIKQTEALRDSLRKKFGAMVYIPGKEEVFTLR